MAAISPRLNEAQRQAVEALDGPVLVLAGAGTGKTRVLTTRLAHILVTGRAFPASFSRSPSPTRRRARCASGWRRSSAAPPRACGSAPSTRSPRASCAAMPRWSGSRSNFTILDTDDQLRLLKQLIAAANIDERRWPARALLGVIERWKDRGLSPDKVPAGEAGDYADGRAVELYRAISGAARDAERVRFRRPAAARSDAVHRTIRRSWRPTSGGSAICWSTSTRTPTSRNICGCGCWRSGTRNLCCVGDDDQSIYSWRGAEIGNILRFESDFPGALIVRLEQNYRSTPQILAAAAGLIAHNRGRLGKTLWTRAGEGEKVTRARRCGTPRRRRAGSATRSRRCSARGTRCGEIAILVRAGFQTREFEERFIALALPYRVIGGPRFYERQEIRDAMAYLRLVHQPADDLAFERIVNMPRRGIGTATMQLLHAAARAEACRWSRRRAQLIGADELPRAARNALGGFRPALDRWRAEADRAVAHRAGADRARRVRLHRHVAGRQIAGGAGPAGKPEGAGRRDGRVREPRRLSRTCQPGDGQRRRQRRRHGQPDDAAQRQGAGVRHGLPAGLGGGAVPEPALGGGERASRAWRRSAASPMSG